MLLQKRIEGCVAMIILVAGLPGTGKTSVARELSKKLGAELLRSDVIRKEILGKRTYAQEEKFAVYDEMFERAERIKNVVLDATFYKEELRNRARKLANALGTELFIVECVCPEELVKERLEKRYGDDSEAGYAAYKVVKREFEPIKEWHIVTDTRKAPEENAEKAATEIQNQIQKEIVEALKKPGAYPHPVKYVNVKETHISWVFLTGDYAYKVKKAIKFNVVDYSALEKRRLFAEKELTLNKRLCAPIYISVARIVKENGTIKISDAGDAIEYALKMKEIQQEKLLSSMLEKNEVGKELIERIAKIMVDFFNRTNGSDKKIVNNFIGLKKKFWDSCFVSVRDFRKPHEDIENNVKGFFEDNKEILGKRIKEGKVKDLHGDAHSRNIFVDSGNIYIYDCIEFDDELRHEDIAYEIAALAMDLDFHNRHDLSQHYIDTYLQLSGDSDAIKLFPFYLCYWAYVRGMVTGF
ncbi:MAG: AAA family ATPase, partial [Candidatus Aenigmatarchaeota archaeon]